MTLSTELQRLADASPPIPVDPDLWRRARTARRRDRALTGVAALAGAGVAVAVAATALPGGGTEPQPAGSPLVVTEQTGTPSDDLAIGTARAAHVGDDGSAVVLGTDGEQHVLRLPGSDGPVALSPDGTRLAWFDATARPALVRQVDLRTGQESSGEPGRVVELDQLVYDQGSWSLGWSGRDDTGTTRAGRLRARASLSDELPTGPDPLVGVMADGAPVALSDGEITALPPSYAPGAPDTRLASSSTDPVVGGCTRGFSLTFLAQDAAGAVTAWTYDVRSEQGDEARQTLPDGLLGGSGDLDLRVVGCLPGTEVRAADRLLLRTEGEGPGDPDVLGVLTLGASPTYDVVGEVVDDVPDLSVATDLVGR